MQFLEKQFQNFKLKIYLKHNKTYKPYGKMTLSLASIKTGSHQKTHTHTQDLSPAQRTPKDHIVE